MLFLNKDNGFNYACISDDIPLSFCFCGENWRKAHDYTVIDELTDRTSKHGGVVGTNKNKKSNTK